MKSSGIPQVGPKSNGECPYKRHRGDMQGGEERPREDGAETGVMWPQARDAWATRR